MSGQMGSAAPPQLRQSMQRQPLPAEPLNPFAARAFLNASYQPEAEENSISQLHLGTMMSQPAMRAAGGYSPLDSVASSTYGMRLPNHTQSKGHGRPFDAWSSQHSQGLPAHSSVWGTDSAEAFPEFVHADMLGFSPGSRHSLDTLEESLDSASALQPHAPTFAHLLQQQNEHAARSRAAQSNPGTSGTVGRLSASQMAYALSALPKISDRERMARFMAALQESRPRASLAPAASDKPPVPPSSHSKQLLHGLSELWRTPPARQVDENAQLSSGTSRASGSGKGLIHAQTGDNTALSLCSYVALYPFPVLRIPLDNGDNALVISVWKHVTPCMGSCLEQLRHCRYCCRLEQMHQPARWHQPAHPGRKPQPALLAWAVHKGGQLLLPAAAAAAAEARTGPRNA